MRDFYDYRLKFSKNGPIRFVGHLDVMRYMQKANRRAGLPVRYSEGFSPHQIMSFALPLSVGATSDGEYLDMSFVREMDTDEIVERLNFAMNEGICAVECRLLPEHAPKSMTLIAAAGYRLRYAAVTDLSEYTAGLRRFLASDTIPAVKKTKTGEREIDLKPLIHGYDISENGDLDIILHAGSRDHVKPALLFERFFDSCGKEFVPMALKVHRTEMYTEKDGVMIPLIELYDHAG
ncbi:MAG: TIGR03936 family radical SAM-associated protein [Lachnospiraceae bacterium]|nr:TIGR03936 family radical SAM-associated protein [Lachnospiraceae bacterium]